MLQNLLFFASCRGRIGREAAGMFQILCFLISHPIKIKDEPCLLQETLTFLRYIFAELRLYCYLTKLTS